MNTLQHQIPLPLNPIKKASFEGFFTAQNQVSIAYLKDLKIAKDTKWPIITGPTGSGKSHLLNALLKQYDGDSVLLDLKDTRWKPEHINQLNHFTLIAIDNLHHIFGSLEWEEAIFHLYNQLRQCHHTLAITLEKPSQHYQLALPDLASRLTWGIQLELKPINKEDLSEYLKFLAQKNYIELSEKTRAYILTHSSRNAGDLATLMNHIASKSLSLKKKPSIPMIRSIIESPLYF